MENFKHLELPSLHVYLLTGLSNQELKHRLYLNLYTNNQFIVVSLQCVLSGCIISAHLV